MYHARMRVHHIALRTHDLPRLERFYGEVVGLALSRPADARSVWFDAGGTLVMLETADAHEPTPPAGTRELLAFAIEPGERAAMEARLASAGVFIEARTDFTLYFRDPDGRRVGLSSYPKKN